MTTNTKSNEVFVGCKEDKSPSDFNLDFFGTLVLALILTVVISVYGFVLHVVFYKAEIIDISREVFKEIEIGKKGYEDALRNGLTPSIHKMDKGYIGITNNRKYNISIDTSKHKIDIKLISDSLDEINNKHITLTLDENYNWSCSTDMEDRFVPLECRSNN